MEAYESLERLVLSPLQEIVFIEVVIVPSQKVYEIFLYNLEDCWNKVI